MDDKGIGLATLFPLLLVVIGIAFILYGLTAASGCVGDELMWIGAGIVIGDFGGFVIVKHPAVLIGGGGGLVVLIVGAAFRALLRC
jgi:hypothetical protein